jgi:integrase
MKVSADRGGIHHLATLIALDTGMRPAEIRGRQWEDWAPRRERPNLHVVRSVDADGVEEKPKTE